MRCWNDISTNTNTFSEFWILTTARSFSNAFSRKWKFWIVHAVRNLMFLSHYFFKRFHISAAYKKNCKMSLHVQKLQAFEMGSSKNFEKVRKESLKLYTFVTRAVQSSLFSGRSGAKISRNLLNDAFVTRHINLSLTWHRLYCCSDVEAALAGERVFLFFFVPYGTCFFASSALCWIPVASMQSPGEFVGGIS